MSEWCFFLWCLFVFIAVYFYQFFLFYCVIAYFNHKNNSFFAHELHVPLVLKAKRIVVGSFQCSLTEDGIMFVLSYFCGPA